MNETMNLETKMRKVLPVIHKLTRRYGYAEINDIRKALKLDQGNYTAREMIERKLVRRPARNQYVITKRGIAAITATLVLAVLVVVPASAQNQTTFRDAGGRTTGTATRDSNGTTTFRDSSGRMTGTATPPRNRRMGR
jgi:hypothetical protein